MDRRLLRLALAAGLAGLLGLSLLWGGASGLEPGARAPELGGGPWLNGGPMRLADQRGKVVLLDMWTFG